MLTSTGAHYPSANGTASFDVGVVPPATEQCALEPGESAFWAYRIRPLSTYFILDIRLPPNGARAMAILKTTADAECVGEEK
jgi:hypothetical protein